MPSFQLRAYNLGNFFTTKPWDAIGYMALLVRPFLLGLIFLVPLDIAFSCWVFFFFWKAQLVLGEAWGFQKRPEFPEQSAGAYIALCVIAIWTGRHHFSRVIRSVWDRRLAGDSKGEALPYNVAVYGVIAGFLFIVIFCYQAGMTWWGAAVFFALLLMTNIGVTRIRAEVGSPVHDLHFAGPEILMLDAFGTRRVGPRTLSIVSLFWFLTRAHYSDPMPHQLEGFRIADRSRMNQRRVFAVMLIAIVVGTVIAFWALLDAGYKHGASWGGEPLGRLKPLVNLSHAAGYVRNRLFFLWITVRSVCDVYAGAVPVVAAPPCRLRRIQHLRDARHVVHVLYGVAHQVDSPEGRRHEGAPRSHPVFPRHGLRGLHHRHLLGVVGGTA